MKSKKIPMRMCVACREMKPKKELIRVVRNAEGEIHVDLSSKASGRGAYLCCNQACLGRAQKIRALERALDQSIQEETWNILKGEIAICAEK